MFTKLQLHLSKVFLKIFLRDRQSIIFNLMFPLIFMAALGFVNDSDQDPFRVGIVNNAGTEVAQEFIVTLGENPLFSIEMGDEDVFRQQLIDGEKSLVLLLPEDFDTTTVGTEIELIVDAAQMQQLSLIMPVLDQALIGIEREFRDTQPMFSVTVEDVQARSQRYLDFLLPGLLAFTLMQIGIAGSGFNIVEYRRKGILKRLFVTPIQPKDFIFAIVVARLALCLMQLSALLAFAVFVLKANVVGDFVSLYSVIILGTVIFLCLGFCLGSIAKTQQAVMAVGNLVIFPQIFLSGIFYPIDSMPALIQPIASILPLSFVATGLREIATGGASLFDIVPSLIGIAVWFVVGFVLATRLFVWKEVAA